MRVKTKTVTKSVREKRNGKVEVVQLLHKLISSSLRRAWNQHAHLKQAFDNHLVQMQVNALPHDARLDAAHCLDLHVEHQLIQQATFLGKLAAVADREGSSDVACIIVDLTSGILKVKRQQSLSVPKEKRLTTSKRPGAVCSGLVLST